MSSMPGRCLAGGRLVRQHRAGGVGQAGADVAEVLVPDHVVRLALRIGPLEDHRGAAIADHDAVFREGLGRLDDETRGVDGDLARAVALGQ